MTDRRVQIEVTAKFGDVIKGADEASVALKVTQEEMKGLDKQIEETTRDMEKMSVVIIAGKKEVADLGDKSRGAKRDLESLDARIVASRKNVQELGLEFARTGDKIDGGNLGRERSLLAKLEKLRKELTAGGDSNGAGRGILADVAGVAREAEQAAGEAVVAGEKVGGSFLSGIGSAFDGMGPAVKGGLIAGLVGAALLALPAIGGAISGAVVGVAGVGGIAGGIFAASKDPVVKSAATQFGADISRMFFASGGSFIDPIRKALALLDDDFAKLDLKGVFAEAAPFVVTLAAGIGDLVKNVMPGFRLALERGAPFIATMAKGLAYTGTALSEFLDNISRSHGAIEGLDFLFRALGGTIKFLGALLNFLSDAFHAFNVFMRGTLNVLDQALDMAGMHSDKVHDMLKVMEQVTQQNPQLIDGTKLLGDAFAGSAQDVKGMTQALKDNQSAIDDWINKSLALGDANTAVAQDFADLNDKLVKGKKNWDDNTQAGRDNRTEIRQVIRDMEAQRVQAIATSDGSQAAIDAINKKYNDLLAQLEAAAIKAGDTKAAFEAMAGTYHITIITDIITAAQAARATKTDKSSKFAGFASGGETPSYAPFVVGEHGPEVLWDSKRHYVETRAQAQTWHGSGGGNSGGGEITLRVIHQTPDGRVLRTELIREANGRGTPTVTTAAAYP